MAKGALRSAALLAALLVPALLAACSGAGHSPLPPALAPTQPGIAPPLAPSGAPGAPSQIIPGRRPFAIPPPFTLPRVGGGTVSLSDHEGEGPVVVVFYRGYF